MMSEPKGRSGKKPKYQIADIGGSELTSEDISTERVLNFLIKGERDPAEQGGYSGAGGVKSEDIPLSTTLSQPSLAPESSSAMDDASSERPLKKSLSHLFERAGSGGGLAKDLKLKLSDSEHATVPSLPPPVLHQAIAAEEVIEDKRLEASRHEEVKASSPEKPDAPPVKISSKLLPEPATDKVAEEAPQAARATEPLPDQSTPSSTELAHYIELWRDFYRLKSGEIDVLSMMFRMSYDDGRSECYIKMRKLAETSNLDYRYCQKVVRSLERLGWITKLQDYDAITQLGVLYRVNLKPTQML